jgi:hypothetical protein
MLHAQNPEPNSLLGSLAPLRSRFTSMPNSSHDASNGRTISNSSFSLQAGTAGPFTPLRSRLRYRATRVSKWSCASFFPQLCRDRTVTLQAQSPDVFEITFAPAFDYGNDMIGVPEAFSTSRSETESPFQPSLQASRASQSLQMFPGRQAIDAALHADTLVSFQYFFADISRIGAQPPLLHAPVRAERQPALRHLQTAPAA